MCWLHDADWLLVVHRRVLTTRRRPHLRFLSTNSSKLSHHSRSLSDSLWVSNQLLKRSCSEAWVPRLLVLRKPWSCVWCLYDRFLNRYSFLLCLRIFDQAVQSGIPVAVSITSQNDTNFSRFGRQSRAFLSSEVPISGIFYGQGPIRNRHGRHESC